MGKWLEGAKQEMITPSYPLTAAQQVAPKLNLDFTSAVLDPRITLTRAAATATRFNSDGEIEVMSADTARFDHDPITKVCKGLLIEEARTNLYTNSFITKNLGNNMTYTDGDVAPDPTQFFVLGQEDATTGEHYFQDRFLSVVSGNTYTFSVYAKQGIGDRLLVLRIDLGSALFDFETQAVTSTGGYSSVSMTHIGGGIYRCQGTFTATSTTNYLFRLQLFGAGFSYPGDGVSGIQVWGAQVEEGAFPTSYIPTAASAVTRNADVATMTGTDFSDWYNASKGTFRVDASTPAIGVRPTVVVDDDTADNNIAMLTDGTSAKLIVNESGSEIANVSAGTVTANTPAFAYASYDTNYFGIARPTARQNIFADIFKN
jgi:hypothetical protein